MEYSTIRGLKNNFLHAITVTGLWKQVEVAGATDP